MLIFSGRRLILNLIFTKAANDYLLLLLLILLLSLLFYSLEFFTSTLADTLSLEFEWQQVSRTLLSILAVLNNAVFWMVSPRPPTSKSSRSFNNPFLTVPKAPITIGIIVTFMFYSLFSFQARYLSLFAHSFSFISHPSSSDRKSQLNWLFSNPPKSSTLASGAWCHSHPAVSFSIWGFYFDICEWHISSPHAR